MRERVRFMNFNRSRELFNFARKVYESVSRLRNMNGSTMGDSRVNRHRCQTADRMVTTTGQCRRKCGRICLIAVPLLLVVLISIDSTVGGQTTTIVRHTDTVEPQLDGFWTNRTTWNARWVKYWRAKRIYEPVWKKVWTPTILKEWIPLPNAPAPDAWKDKKGKHDYS
ncbi:uncharacterized protein LOC108652687 [Drosophila navojoa]|nr:uncharacterized protein LOC108652687 [Drosophila navojoa]